MSMIGMSTERVPCPFCKELILPSALKCRFCGEKIDIRSKNIQEPIRKYYWAWFVTLVFFYIALLGSNLTNHPFWIIFMLPVVLIGICLFLVLIAKVLTSLNRHQGKWYGLATLVTFFAFFGLLTMWNRVEGFMGVTPTASKANPQAQINSIPLTSTSKSVTKPIQKETSTANTNKIDCIGPDGKEFSTTMEECKNLNEKWGKPVDYMLNCNIHPDCGGGVVRMSKSQCDKPCSGLSIPKTYQTSQGTTSTSPTNYITPQLPNSPNTSNYQQPTITNNAELRDKCLSEVQSKYQTGMSRLRNQARALGSSTSTSEYLLKQELEREKQNCESRYPL